jgi:hypothetical protein
VASDVRQAARIVTYSEYVFGENEHGKAAENSNQKEAYKLFAVH